MVRISDNKYFFLLFLQKKTDDTTKINAEKYKIAMMRLITVNVLSDIPKNSATVKFRPDAELR